MAYKNFKTGTSTVRLDLGGLNPKQKLFCQARSKYVAYGGARGGGKTHIVRIKAIMGCLAYPGIRILVVRREYPELEQTVILPMKKMVPEELASYNGTMHMLFFSNGSAIKFGHYGAGDDLEYQGQEYDWIFMDEATQFTEDQFLILCACLRGANKIPKRIYLTCNPGGIGHFWVKRLFVDKEYKEDEDPADYTFIQAKATDNSHIEKDYIRQLANQPPDRRAAWLEGDWNALSGTFFPEVKHETHLFPAGTRIPPEWVRYRAFDYGLDMLACLWIAVDFDGRCWVYRELTRPGLTVSDAAEAMLSMTLPGEQITANLAPPDMWSRTKDTGKTMAEIFAMNGLGLIKASNNRVQGWMSLKELLKPMEDGRPGLLFSEDCKTVFEHLQMIQHSEKDPNDCSVEPHDITHAPDALRYFAVTRVMTSQQAPKEEPPELGEERVEDYDEAMTGGEAGDDYINY